MIAHPRHALFAAALAVLLSGPAAAAPTPAERVNALGEEMLEREFDLIPALETFTEGPGPRAGRAIIDLSPDAVKRRRALYREVLARLAAIPVAELDPSSRTAYELMRFRASTSLAANESEERSIQLATPIRNAAQFLVTVSNVQPLRTTQDFDTWLARLEASSALFDQSIARLEAAAARGWTAPRSLATKTLAQVEGIASKPARESAFWPVMNRFPADAGPEARAAFEKRYEAALEQRLRPALNRFATYLRDTYIPKARTTAGLGALPGGERAYRAIAHAYTTLETPPAEIHAIGLAEAERIRPKALAVARSLGFEGEMREMAAWLDAHPANHPFNTPDEVLEHLRRINARVVPTLPKLFHRLPKAAFEIRLAPAAIAASASPNYLPPTKDGSRPGVFQMPVVDARKMPMHWLGTVLVHEGMPGHHLDAGLRVELELPRYRRTLFITAHGEGWGLYSEALGEELGIYDDPWSMLGRHLLERRRAARLVTDTGLHWKGWSREEAIAYFVANGQDERESTVEVERFIADPGQALAYKIGELEILRLREEARKKMGARFDVRDFHQIVIGEGPLTLAMLRQRVNEWSGGSATPAAKLHALAEEMVERELDLSPVSETYYQGPGPRAGRALSDRSPGAHEAKARLYREVLAGLDQIDPKDLAESDRLNYALLREHARKSHARREWPIDAIDDLTPIANPLNSLVRAASSQPLRSESDFETWLARVEASAAMFDQSRASLEAAARKGWVLPRSLVEKTLAQIEPVAAKGAYESPFWAVLARYPAEGGDAKRNAFRERYRKALDGKVLPAIRGFAAWARKDYLPKARATSGIGALPGGDKAYATLVREYTTLELAPAEVHALGLAEVARIRTKLLEVARRVGFTGEMRDYSAWIANTAANLPFTTDEEVLAYLRGVHARVEPQLPRLFSRLPRAALEIRAVDKAIAATSSANYSRPSADGQRPGRFNMPIPDPRKVAASRLTTLYLHEGLPGHHLDNARKVELDLPRFRKLHGITVYGEGWGLYAESLGFELGVYDDPWALLGHYEGELHRAARLVVDTGMHWKGWSREQAIRYLVEERGQVERDATVAIERYMSRPGQALAYKVGQLEIQRLRDEAAKALGRRFDVREFHEAVLGAGPLTLELLRERVRAWIARPAA